MSTSSSQLQHDEHRSGSASTNLNNQSLSESKSGVEIQGGTSNRIHVDVVYNIGFHSRFTKLVASLHVHFGNGIELTSTRSHLNVFEVYARGVLIHSTFAGDGWPDMDIIVQRIDHLCTSFSSTGIPSTQSPFYPQLHAADHAKVPSLYHDAVVRKLDMNTDEDFNDSQLRPQYQTQQQQQRPLQLQQLKSQHHLPVDQQLTSTSTIQSDSREVQRSEQAGKQADDDEDGNADMNEFVEQTSNVALFIANREKLKEKHKPVLNKKAAELKKALFSVSNVQSLQMLRKCVDSPFLTFALFAWLLCLIALLHWYLLHTQGMLHLYIITSCSWMRNT
jgi:hypothetical protein